MPDTVAWNAAPAMMRHVPSNPYESSMYRTAGGETKEPTDAEQKSIPYAGALRFSKYVPMMTMLGA